MSNTKVTQQMLSGIPAGGKNYFSLSGANGDFANGSVLPWTTFAATLSNGVPTTFTTGGTGGMTIAINSTAPLGDSLYDLILTKPASNVVGTGMISGVLTLNKEDKFSTILGYFSYLASNTNFDSSGTGTQSLEVWILDVTATAALGSNQWIQPSNYRGMNGSPKLAYSWQSSAVAGNQYRIAIFTAQTSALAYAVEFASFSLAPLPLNQAGGTASSIVGVYGGGSSAFGSTNTSVRRFATLDQNIGSAITYVPSTTLGDTFLVNEPGLYSMMYGDGDTSGTSVLIITRNSTAVIGVSGVQSFQISSTALILANGVAVCNSLCYLNKNDVIRAQDANNLARSTTQATRDVIFSIAKITPAVGTGDGSVVSAKYYTGASGTSSTTTPINFGTKVYDDIGLVTTGSSWKATPQVFGKYKITLLIDNSAATTSNYVIVYKNGAPLENIGYTLSTFGTQSMSTTIELNATDYFDIRTGSSYPYVGNASRSAANCFIEIEKISGGVTINPNTPVDATVVKAKFGNTIGSNLSTTANTDIIFPKTYFDTYSMYNPATGVLKVPSPGYYDFNSTNLYLTGSNDYVSVFANGTFIGALTHDVTSLGLVVSGFNSFYLLPTDVVTFRTGANNSIGSGGSSTSYSFSITVTKNTGGVNFNSSSMPTVTTLNTAGSGTYNTPQNVRYLRVRMVGGGGGGGTFSSYVGGGGGSGAYIEFYVYSPVSSYAYVVGAGGAAQTNGGNTTFNGNTAGGGVASSGGGGAGGLGGTATFVNGTKITAVNGGGGGCIGNYSSIGTPGGEGGNSAFGGGARANAGTNSTGANGEANTGGGGAGGAASGGSGGVGGSGVILIEEFY